MDTRSVMLGAAGAVVAVGALGGAYYLGHRTTPPPDPLATDQSAPLDTSQSPTATTAASSQPAPAWPGSTKPHRVRRVDLGYFHSALAPYGRWQNDERWGEVWQPEAADRDFHPYTDGHWSYTEEFGWTWVSNQRWGDVVFHYGRWVDDPDRGWLWVPGYVWGPGWVVWRSGAGHAGWMPMPPDRAFLQHDDRYDRDWSEAARDDYGYRDWYGDRFDRDRSASLWVYVDLGHLTDPDYRRYAVRRPDEVWRLHQQTADVTRLTTAGGYVTDRSLNPQQVAQSGHPIRPVAAVNVIRHAELVAPVAMGHAARQPAPRPAPQRVLPANHPPARAGEDHHPPVAQQPAPHAADVHQRPDHRPVVAQPAAPQPNNRPGEDHRPAVAQHAAPQPNDHRAGPDHRPVVAQHPAPHTPQPNDHRPGPGEDHRPSVAQHAPQGPKPSAPAEAAQHTPPQQPAEAAQHTPPQRPAEAAPHTPPQHPTEAVQHKPPEHPTEAAQHKPPQHPSEAAQHKPSEHPAEARGKHPKEEKPPV